MTGVGGFYVLQTGQTPGVLNLQEVAHDLGLTAGK